VLLNGFCTVMHVRVQVQFASPFATWTSWRRWAGWEPLGEGIHNCFLKKKVVTDQHSGSV
jgi:hypothetical protein